MQRNQRHPVRRPLLGLLALLVALAPAFAFASVPSGPTVRVTYGEGESAVVVGYGDLDDGRLDLELLSGSYADVTVTIDFGNGDTFTQDGSLIDGVLDVTVPLNEALGMDVEVELDDSVGPDDDADDGMDDDRDDDDR
ncbi:MAG: hypothetical protein U5J97_01280 [Trueperaceae bacterium]|nr:hypothetical protein [Trueperaceae bacterium]